MKRVGKNSIALGLVMALITLALSFSANGATDPVAQSNSSAITASGVTGIVDSDQCTASSPTGTPTDGTGNCGVNLGAVGIVKTFSQTASTALDGNKGTSTAAASVAPIDIANLQQLDVSTLQGDLGTINTGTVIDGVVNGLNNALLEQLFNAALTPILTQVQDALVSSLTNALAGNVDVSVVLPAVESTCTAVAGSDGTMNSVITGDVHITAALAGNQIADVVLPVKDLSPNSALIGAVAPQEIVDAILADVKATMLSDGTLTGALGPLADVLDTVQTQLVDTLLAQIGPSLLAPVGDALGPVLTGTVNKQTTNSDGSVEVTPLDLNVLGDGATLTLARSACGPNTTVDANANTDANANADTNANADANANANADADANANADTNANADANADADANANADADVTSTLPNTGAPNVMPLLFLALGLIAFGTAVLANEKRRRSMLL